MNKERDLAAQDADDSGHNKCQDTGKFSMIYETSVSLSKYYICHLCGSSEQNRVAVALSDFSICLYDLNGLKQLTKFQHHNKPITGIRFNPKDNNFLFSSSIDGAIHLWDLRDTNKPSMTFKDETSESGTVKPILSFDVSNSGRFLCGGTEVYDGDAFLDFWDIRSGKLLGGYWESHNDDITQVNFHPVEGDIVASGSTDGLINIFDLSKDNEDDALLYSLNTESTVDKIRWLSWKGEKNVLSCITDTMDIQIWKDDDASPFICFSRSEVANAMKCKEADYSYTIDILQDADDKVYFLAGSEVDSRNSLSLLSLENNELNSKRQLPQNKQIVRCSWLHPKTQHLVTGGESGIITVWGETEKSEEKEKSSPLKVTSKHASGRVRPY